MYYNEIARTGTIPFEIKTPNADTLEAMRDADENRNCKSFDCIEDLMKDLND